MPRQLCVYRLNRLAGKSVLLTFDDGPKNPVTVEVLERLGRYQARAIFFVVGNRIAGARNVLKLIADGGHYLGNHSWSHPNKKGIGLRDYYREVRQCQEAVFQHSGLYPKFHRPPRGSMGFAALYAAWRLDLVNLMWSYSSEDWQFRADGDARDRATRIAQEIQPGDIVLFHDEYAHTIVALDHILPALKARGIDLNPGLDSIC